MLILGFWVSDNLLSNKSRYRISRNAHSFAALSLLSHSEGIINIIGAQLLSSQMILQVHNNLFSDISATMYNTLIERTDILV